MTTRAEAVAAAGRCIAEARYQRDTLPVEEAARLAYTPTGPSLAELEERIRARREAVAAVSDEQQPTETSRSSARRSA